MTANITKGKVEQWSYVNSGGMRLTVPGTNGSNATIRFSYMGPSPVLAPLASSAVIHQIGLKLLSKDPCNLVYAMWDVENQKLRVMAKVNPGMTSSQECGADGYTTQIPEFTRPPPVVRPDGSVHELVGTIHRGVLLVSCDGNLCWMGRLLELDWNDGEAGARTDNGVFVFAFHAEPLAETRSSSE